MDSVQKMQNSLYDKYASEYAEAIKDNTYNAHFERPSLISLLPEVEGKNILELGCGSGELVDLFLKKHCQQVTAVDHSLPMVNLIKERFDSSVNCYQQNLEVGIPNEKDSSFDLVVSSLAMHYISDIDFLFSDIFRVLKEKGHFVFSIHHPFADFQDPGATNYFACEQLTQTWNTIGKPVDVTFLRRSLSSICKALTDAGFYISCLSEGSPTKHLKTMSEELYKQLTTKPFFLFFKCIKI